MHRGVGLLEVTSEELRASVLAIALWRSRAKIDTTGTGSYLCLAVGREGVGAPRAACSQRSKRSSARERGSRSGPSAQCPERGPEDVPRHYG